MTLAGWTTAAAAITSPLYGRTGSVRVPYLAGINLDRPGRRVATVLVGIGYYC